MSKYESKLDREKKWLLFGGIWVMVISLVFFVVGLANYVTSRLREDERIYAEAHIVDIVEYETGDSEHPKGYTTYVRYETSSGMITGTLNEYRSGYKIGDMVEVYYYSDDIYSVYCVDSDITGLLILLLPFGAVIFGALIVFSKRVRVSLARISMKSELQG